MTIRASENVNTAVNALKVLRDLNVMKRKCYNFNNFSNQIKLWLKVFDSVILSLVLYGTEIWGPLQGYNSFILFILFRCLFVFFSNSFHFNCFLEQFCSFLLFFFILMLNFSFHTLFVRYKSNDCIIRPQQIIKNCSQDSSIMC